MEIDDSILETKCFPASLLTSAHAELGKIPINIMTCEKMNVRT